MVYDYNPKMGLESFKIPEVSGKPTPLQEGADDWPAWKGVNADNSSTFTAIKTDWSKGLKKLWEIKYLCQGKKSASWSCPAIKGNRLVIPGRDETHDHIYCLDPDTGKLLWHKSYKAPSGSDTFGEGQRATPLIDEDRVYTISRGGDLICWKLYDGETLWQKNLKSLGGKIPIWGHSASPVLLNSKLILQAGGEAQLIALDKYSGKLIWNSGPGEGSYSTPVIFQANNKKMILLFAGKSLAAFSPDTGKKLWDTPWPLKNNINVITPPIEEKQKIAIISSWYKKGIQAVRISEKEPKILWKNNNIEAHQTDPFILNGYIYGYSGMSAFNKNDFKCLDLKTGKEIWTTTKLGTGQFIYVKPFFICLDIKGGLFLIKPEPKGLNLVTSFKGAVPGVKKRVWTKPIVARGKLYLRYVNHLICYDIAD